MGKREVSFVSASAQDRMMWYDTLPYNIIGLNVDNFSQDLAGIFTPHKAYFLSRSTSSHRKSAYAVQAPFFVCLFSYNLSYVTQTKYERLKLMILEAKIVSLEVNCNLNYDVSKDGVERGDVVR